MESGLSRYAERKFCRSKEYDGLKGLLQNHKTKMEETLEESIREGQLLDLITFNKMIIEHHILRVCIVRIELRVITVNK